MYFVKGLEHVDKYIRWAETKYKNVKVIQVPHWNLTYILRSGMFCVPNPRVKLMKLSGIDKSIRLQTGINYSFFGMKKADSLNRRMMLSAYQNGTSATNKVYPLLDFSNKEVMAYIALRKLPSPVRYSKNASGGVGFNTDCFLYMREHYPGDLQKILKTFPASEKLLIDHDNKQ
jgi:sulfate adenylyltransferase subunit 2